jgi:hypothetical protein
MLSRNAPRLLNNQAHALQRAAVLITSSTMTTFLPRIRAMSFLVQVQSLRLAGGDG